MKVVSLRTNESGETYFKDINIHNKLEKSNLGIDVPTLFISKYCKSNELFFLECPVGWVGDWHQAPHDMILVVLKGQVSVQSSDGDTKNLVAGDILITHDGESKKGHYSHVVGDEPLVHICITSKDNSLFDFEQ